MHFNKYSYVATYIAADHCINLWNYKAIYTCVDWNIIIAIFMQIYKN